MVRHTIRNANSHKRHRIAKLDPKRNDNDILQGQEIIDGHPNDHVRALEKLDYTTRNHKYGFFDLNNENTNEICYSKNEPVWYKRFNYAPSTMYPLEITNYNKSSNENNIDKMTAFGTITEHALGSSRQYSGKANPKDHQWHTIGGACGGAIMKNGIDEGEIWGNLNKPCARFMLNPLTDVMKNINDPWEKNSSVHDSQYVFQIGRKMQVGNDKKWCIDNGYEVSFGTNPVTKGDFFITQPGYASNYKVDTWDGKDIGQNNKTRDQKNWRKFVVGYGDNYNTLLEGGSTGFNYTNNYISNPKWSTMTSRPLGTQNCNGIVDTGIISSYTSQLMMAGTGICVSAGKKKEFVGKDLYVDGVLKLGGVHWNGVANPSDEGQIGGLFIPYFNDKENSFGIQKIGGKDDIGMATGFFAQKTNNVKDTGYLTELVLGCEGAFNKENGTFSGTGVFKVHRKSIMNNNGKDNAMNGKNYGRNMITTSWVQYNDHHELGQTIKYIVGGDGLYEGQIIDTHAHYPINDRGPGSVRIGGNDSRHTIMRSGGIMGENYLMFTPSPSELLHSHALVVAQFVRDTAEVFDDMHITELYPNSNYLSSKSTWMRNYDIIFTMFLPNNTTDDDSLVMEIDQNAPVHFDATLPHYKVRSASDKYKIPEDPNDIDDWEQNIINRIKNKFPDDNLIANSNEFWAYKIQAMPTWNDTIYPSGNGQLLTEQQENSDFFTTTISTVKKSSNGRGNEKNTKTFVVCSDTVEFLHPITQKITAPFLATSVALRGLLFADKDYVTIEDISYNLYSAGSWCVAGDLAYAHFDIREHVFDHMEQDLGIPSYYWDAYSSLQLERQLITLNNFSRFDMHRKISLCWWDVLRIFDADDDIIFAKDENNQLTLTSNKQNASRMISGHLKENDTLAVSCVVRNPHPEVKDIDMRLIFQCIDDSVKHNSITYYSKLTPDGFGSDNDILTWMNDDNYDANNNPISVNGYYPLYVNKSISDSKSSQNSSHEHTFNGTVYYMPDGLGDDQYHGNYTA